MNVKKTEIFYSFIEFYKMLALLKMWNFDFDSPSHILSKWTLEGFERTFPNNSFFRIIRKKELFGNMESGSGSSISRGSTRWTMILFVTCIVLPDKLSGLISLLSYTNVKKQRGLTEVATKDFNSISLVINLLCKEWEGETLSSYKIQDYSCEINRDWVWNLLIYTIRFVPFGKNTIFLNRFWVKTN